MPISTSQYAAPASMQGPFAFSVRGTPDATTAWTVHVRCGHMTAEPGRSDLPDTADLYGGPGNATLGSADGQSVADGRSP